MSSKSCSTGTSPIRYTRAIGLSDYRLHLPPGMAAARATITPCDRALHDGLDAPAFRTVEWNKTREVQLLRLQLCTAIIARRCRAPVLRSRLTCFWLIRSRFPISVCRRSQK